MTGRNSATQEARVQSFSPRKWQRSDDQSDVDNASPWTYLLDPGHAPFQFKGPWGLYGMVVVTDATTGTAYPAVGRRRPAVTLHADASFLFSEIPTGPNNAVSTAVNTTVFRRQGLSGQPGGCGNPSRAPGFTRPAIRRP